MMKKGSELGLKPSVLVIDEPWDSNISQAEWEKRKQALMKTLSRFDEKAIQTLQANATDHISLRG